MRHGALAVAQREQRELLAVEVLLDDDLAGAEALLDEELVAAPLGLAPRPAAMTTPLPAASPSNLSTTG